MLCMSVSFVLEGIIAGVWGMGGEAAERVTSLPLLCHQAWHLQYSASPSYEHQHALTADTSTVS